MYTDIHSHVIWGVDDGAEEKAEARGREIGEARGREIGEARKNRENARAMTGREKDK